MFWRKVGFSGIFEIEMLTAQQLQQFKNQGYLVVEDVFDRAQILEPLIAEYRTRLHELCADWVTQGLLSADVLELGFEDCIKAVYDAGLDYFQPLDISLPPEQITGQTPMHAGAAVFDMMTAPSLLDLVESIIGSEITSNPIQHVRIKPPSTQLYQNEIRAHITATHWHQDRAVTLEEADHSRMVTAWIAVNDATVENGCLQVIPGSHKNDMQPHCPSPQLSIPSEYFDLAEATPVPVKAGGVVFFDPLTIHSSRDNLSCDVRWSFDLRYNVTGDPTGRQIFPSFVARSNNNPQSVLRDPQKWAELWQQTKRELISQPPVVIHRWPADADYCA